MNVVLVGFRCAGKSSVGRTLAERLKCDFVDCDEYIERKTALSIREIFDIAGESYFRMLESDAIADLSRRDGIVIATGGGAVLRYKNIRNLKRNSRVFFLEVGAESAYERFQSDPATQNRRPSLTGKDIFTEIRAQVEFRRPYYQSAADVVVQTDGRPLEEVVKEILEHLQGHGLEEHPDEGDAQPA
ncbi:MAG: shikimate kinase [Planctomycetes bacterium]|nr:shikimate kinase [Planctomycetota bacterium]